MSNKTYFVPKQFRNPLLKYPREHSCICGSGEQFQECCLKYQRRAIPAEWAERIKQVWNRLLTGELRIVPPKEALRAEQPDTPMPVVPMVAEKQDGMLAGTADTVDAAVVDGSESEMDSTKSN